MNYWQFFPTGEEGWGIVPVWGFATVCAVAASAAWRSASGSMATGRWPPAPCCSPSARQAERFTDAAPHRARLPAVYNQYLRCSADPLYSAEHEGLQALLRPLFITSWLIDDFLADNDFFGARHGAAVERIEQDRLRHRLPAGPARPGIEVVGLTSAANRAFCESLGCYDRVLAYEELDQVAADAPCVYVDFAGNARAAARDPHPLREPEAQRSIGGTHVDQLAASGAGKGLPGPRATLFFAPAQVKKRSADWGAGAVRPAHGAGLARPSWARSRDPKAPWLTAQHHAGAEAVQAAYAAVLAGRGDPRVGHILTLTRENP